MEKRQERNQQKRPTNVAAGVVMTCLSELKNGIKLGDVKDILATLPFDKISIPVYTYKNLIFTNSDKPVKGNMIVGYATYYDALNEVLGVSLLPKNARTILDFKDLICYPRAIIDKETNAIKILSLELCPASLYERRK